MHVALFDVCVLPSNKIYVKYWMTLKDDDSVFERSDILNESWVEQHIDFFDWCNIARFVGILPERWLREWMERIEWNWAPSDALQRLPEELVVELKMKGLL